MALVHPIPSPDLPSGAIQYSLAEAARAANPDRPVFGYLPDAVVQHARHWQRGFPGLVSYAVKANPSKVILRALISAGITVFDVASPGEMKLVKQLMPTARLHYHNPVKSSEEIRRAAGAFGCRRFAVDCEEELRKLVSILGGDRAVEIAVRFRVDRESGAIHDFRSKFGCETAEAVRLARLAHDAGFGVVLTAHPGSQCLNPGAWCGVLQTAADIARQAGVEPRSINLGGGFPAPYAVAPVPELEKTWQLIRASAGRWFPGSRPELECEPGRALAAPGGALLTTVKLVRRAQGELFLNDGVYGCLQEVQQAAAFLPVYQVLRKGRPVHSEPHQVFTVFGPTCDPLDRLPEPLALPEKIEEGDVVAFCGLGAYSTATATRFNGYGDFDEVILGDRIDVATLG